MSNNKTIIIITSSFPFGSGEIFFKTELTYLQKEFKRLVIFTSEDENGSSETPQANIEAYKFDIGKNLRFFSAIFSSELWRDFGEYIFGSSSQKSFKGIKHLFKMYSSAYAKKNQIHRFLIKQNICIDENLYFYSYWMTDDAMAIGILNRGNHLNHAFSRAHGYDVYESPQ